ncbi:MAG TPA: lytic transglycosylase domain-containing protein [Caulobacteraceae bacterium]
MKRQKRGPLLALAVVAAMIAGHADAKSRHHKRHAPPPNYSAIARAAYYGGDMDKALSAAPRGGERWIAGLAAYRLKKFDDAKGFFQAVADDFGEDAQLRAAAAFWAARSVTADGRPELAERYLRMAAMSPTTFYGMIAQRQLAMRAGGEFIRLASLASTPAYWASSDDYPTPELFPAGGFTLDKALVYAMVRQESRFNPYAVSPAGAVGLMQLMPAAAAYAAGDDNLKTNVIPLFDAPTNLRLGQDYFHWLLSEGVGDYDMLKAIAAYNGGPGALQKTADRVGPDADSLTLIESLPARETRNYVEQVMTAYWTYRKKFGGETRTLDALALGLPRVDYRVDQ